MHARATAKRASQAKKTAHSLVRSEFLSARVEVAGSGRDGQFSKNTGRGGTQIIPQQSHNQSLLDPRQSSWKQQWRPPSLIRMGFGNAPAEPGQPN